jgi:type I restriction enzyme S subunit
VANTVGTDMANYKIIRRNQFACSIMQVRRDKKMPVALLQDFDEAIISQAYPVFKVKDENELLPEYLMMWFSRAEFDREACFYAVGGVRGSLEWEDFCDMKLPVPDIEIQCEIVAEYNTIKNRMALNNQLIQKLEETAQAIYKQWFVDFEFPDENGSPYKSAGGKMVWNEELEKEIPEGWEYCNIQKLIDKNIIFKNQDGNHGVPFIMAKDILNGFVNTHSCYYIKKEQADKLRIKPAQEGDVLLTHKATMGRVAIIPDGIKNVVLTPQVTYFRPKDRNRINREYLYCLFNSFEFKSQLIGNSEQSTRNFLSITNQRFLKILLPSKIIVNQFKNDISHILRHKLNVNNSSIHLIQLLEILLSKLATIEN